MIMMLSFGWIVMPSMGLSQVITKKTVSIMLAEKLVKACENEARNTGLALSIAVVDDAGHPVLLKRMDGANFKTLDIAKGKALTALLMGAPSAVMQEALENGKIRYLGIDGLLPLQGGLPIIYEGVVIGGIGASGALEELDEKCVQTALGSLK